MSTKALPPSRPPRSVATSKESESVSYRDQPGSSRSHVCASKSVIDGATVEPTSPDVAAVALLQRESSLAFLRSPTTLTWHAPRSPGTALPVVSTRATTKVLASVQRPE